MRYGCPAALLRLLILLAPFVDPLNIRQACSSERLGCTLHQYVTMRVPICLIKRLMSLYQQTYALRATWKSLVGGISIVSCLTLPNKSY